MQTLQERAQAQEAVLLQNKGRLQALREQVAQLEMTVVQQTGALAILQQMLQEQMSPPPPATPGGENPEAK